jgi:hypothetical protein
LPGVLKKYISDHWDLFKSSNYNSNMIFNSDAGIDIFTIFVGTLAEVGIAGIVVYLLVLQSRFVTWRFSFCGVGQVTRAALSWAW